MDREPVDQPEGWYAYLAALEAAAEAWRVQWSDDELDEVAWDFTGHRQMFLDAAESAWMGVTAAHRVQAPRPSLVQLIGRMPTKEWGVYRLYDPFGGAPIYIGMSGNPRMRLRGHVRRFGARFDSFTWEPCASRAEALQVELAAIIDERPVDNVAGVPE